MEEKLIRAAAILGVPGVALVVFYLLLNRFGFTFDPIHRTWAAVIATLFLLMVGGLTAYALHLYRPNRPSSVALAGNTKPQEHRPLRRNTLAIALVSR